MNASTEEQPSSSSFDTLKWGIIFLLLAAAVAGNYVYSEESVLIRAVAVVVLVGIAGLIGLQTEKGRNAAIFAKEARTEVRKVVWPTRQEAIQTTGIVLVVTLLMSVLLWGLDSVLFWLVGLVTGLQVL
ncbi:preprotein translocase subunit SecE [Colwellia echini]|uniref:Protein translocase subunit SecE n=1 Tax=Colwellia echini TaxID=1982103 RepID=A0ABY3MSW8_9GAMM|nr:preprotein translocase subunit SecE [Colwellia echini]TYK64291.1 preprotein translocase subunit SecE [Colwellia echini]